MSTPCILQTALRQARIRREAGLKLLCIKASLEISASATILPTLFIFRRPYCANIQVKRSVPCSVPAKAKIDEDTCHLCSLHATISLRRSHMINIEVIVSSKVSTYCCACCTVHSAQRSGLRRSAAVSRMCGKPVAKKAFYGTGFLIPTRCRFP